MNGMNKVAIIDYPKKVYTTKGCNDFSMYNQ